MTNSQKNIIGLDFGTTNTYLTICPFGTKNKFPLHFSGPSPAVDTAILYADNPGSDADLFPIIGERATLTYGQADQETKEQKGYRYYSNFKPEIISHPAARECAIDFFKALNREAKMLGIDLGSEENSIFIGVPSEADNNFREGLKSLLVEAGICKPEPVDEPKGVLLTDLGYNRFPLADILRGHLVVDFGGGTCDFALLSRGEIVSSWGDMELGGRLFDDLFYQWFLDQNPGILEKLQSARREFYVWSYCCRRLKEDFSETISRNNKSLVSAEVGRFGTVKDLSAPEFLNRAKHYRPSQAFTEFNRSFGISFSHKLINDEIDLIEWFKQLLKEGLKGNEVKNVSLSGGSSKWFFVREMCLELLNLAPEKVLISPNPFGAISEGLAILPTVKMELAGIKAKMSAGKSDFIHTDLMEPVADNIKICTVRLADKITVEMFDGQIAPILREVRQNSFRIIDLENKIAQTIDANRAKVEKIVHSEIDSQILAIKAILKSKVQAWLETFGLKQETLIPIETGPGSFINIEKPISELSRPLILAAEGFMVTWMGLLSAAICGGAGMALLAAGPAGLILGVLGAVGINRLGFTLGRKKIEKITKTRNLPQIVGKTMLSDRYIKNNRQEFRNSLVTKIEGTYKEIFSQLSPDLDDLIGKAINQIDIISLF
jgi:hypothetical protein